MVNLEDVNVENISSPDGSGQALLDFIGFGVIFSSANILPLSGNPVRNKIMVREDVTK